MTPDERMMRLALADKEARIQEAADFLTSYRATYGYFPASQSLGRFRLRMDEVPEVWKRAKAREEN